MRGYRIVLVADGDHGVEGAAQRLRSRGWEVLCEHDSGAALRRLRGGGVSVVVVVDGDNGLVRDVLAGLDVGDSTPVVAFVKPGDVSTAVDAMRLGATTALELVGDSESEVVVAVEGLVPKGAAPSQGRDPRDVITRSDGSPMIAILDTLPQLARSDAPVILTGESGTGKELLARTIHNLSARAEGPFIAVNCGAIPESLLESELFGYVKGSFTGAHGDHKGYFEVAHGGTIFLDEIGEMPPRLQVKLLRVLQDRKVMRVGARNVIDVDFRVVTATNRDLEHAIASGEFREDLFYRIGVLPVHLPPLRSRPMDVALLAEHFVREQNLVNRTQIRGLTKETIALLQRYDWPGNVRELENLIQRLSILKRVGFIERDDLPPQFHGSGQAGQQLGLYVPSEGMDMAEVFERLETQLLTQALRKSDGNKAAAARLLGLNRTTLVEKVKRLKIKEP